MSNLSEKEQYIEDLEYVLMCAENEARLALMTGEFHRHLQHGRTYHRTADELLELTGVDPRPSE
jgi:hypothetical protein